MSEKTLIAVMSCALYPERRAAVRDTWAQDVPAGVDLLFFRGINEVEHFQPEEPGLKILLAPDDYLQLPQKTYALVRYALERGYTRLIKVDDDTYLNIQNALKVLAKGDCVGFERKAPPHNEGIPYPQGGCYSLSQRAMWAVNGNPRVFTKGLEDAAVGRALRTCGILITHDENVKTDYRKGPQPLEASTVSIHGLKNPAIMRDIHRTAKGHNLCVPQL